MARALTPHPDRRIAGHPPTLPTRPLSGFAAWPIFIRHAYRIDAPYSVAQAA